MLWHVSPPDLKKKKATEYNKMFKKEKGLLGVVAHTCELVAWEVETGGTEAKGYIINFRSLLATSETLSQIIEEEGMSKSRGGDKPVSLGSEGGN